MIQVTLIFNFASYAKRALCDVTKGTDTEAMPPHWIIHSDSPAAESVKLTLLVSTYLLTCPS